MHTGPYWMGLVIEATPVLIPLLPLSGSAMLAGRVPSARSGI
jgi:hypothetical protein